MNLAPVVPAASASPSIPGGTTARTQPGPAFEPTPSPSTPILADFSYVIRGAHSMPHYGLIEARAFPHGPVPFSGSFDDAVAAAKLLAAGGRDEIHRLPIQQAHGILQSATGQLSIVPLGGFHRGKDGPLFVDGRMFDAMALSLQMVRRTDELAAIVGADQVFDLRANGAALALPERLPGGRWPEA